MSVKKTDSATDDPLRTVALHSVLKHGHVDGYKTTTIGCPTSC